MFSQDYKYNVCGQRYFSSSVELFESSLLQNQFAERCKNDNDKVTLVNL
jgi:hypothetical protein